MACGNKASKPLSPCPSDSITSGERVPMPWEVVRAMSIIMNRRHVAQRRPAQGLRCAAGPAVASGCRCATAAEPWRSAPRLGADRCVSVVTLQVSWWRSTDHRRRIPAQDGRSWASSSSMPRGGENRDCGCRWCHRCRRPGSTDPARRPVCQVLAGSRLLRKSCLKTRGELQAPLPQRRVAARRRRPGRHGGGSG